MNEEISQHVIKTGTSLVGIICKDGAVIAADRRATVGGTFIAQRDMQKIREITSYFIAAIAGTASDAVISMQVIGAELKLKELKTRSRPSISEAAHLLAISTYRNIRTPSMIPNIVATISGGFNEDGSVEIFSTSPAGDLRKVPDFDANGSGATFMLGLLERTYKKDMPLKDAVELAKECLKSSTSRDAASGNGIDVFTITKDGIKHAVSEEIVPQYK